MLVHTQTASPAVRQTVLETARRCIDTSRYQYFSERCEPPTTVNCVMLVWWTLTQSGLWAPKVSNDLLVNLFESGEYRKRGEAGEPGDLVFTCYPWSKHWASAFPKSGNRSMLVSHVGILTEKETVIHASSRPGRVVEEPYDTFSGEGTYNWVRGVVSLPLNSPASFV